MLSIFNRDQQIDFAHKLFPSLLTKIKYITMDRAIREAVYQLHTMNIKTNSSEGGGGKVHGAPDYAYIEAELSSEYNGLFRLRDKESISRPLPFQ